MTEYMNRNLSRLQPSGIRRFTALAKSTPGCVMLAIGEPEGNTPEPVKDSCKAALDANKTHYPMNAGDPALRQAIADFERQKNGYDYTTDEVLLTAGATEALYVAMTGVLNPGDEVIIPTPAFGLYESIATMAGARCIPLDTAPDNFQITPERLAAAITERTRLIVLNSPNNPTGCVYTPESLQAVHDTVAQRPIFVVCDDVYSRLTYAPCPLFARYRDLRDRLLVVQSYSKPYAMTGWRVGYLLADAPVMQRLLLLHAATVVSIPAPFQEACTTALTVDISATVESYRERRDYVLARLVKMGLPAVRPEGAFYVFPSIQKYGMDAETFATRLITEGGVAGVPGTCFGTDGYIRFSYCCGKDTLCEGMNRLERFLKTLK